MTDTSVNFAPLSDTLSTDERLAALAQTLAQTLATVVERTNPRESNENSPHNGDSSLDILALRRRRRHQLRTRVGEDK